MHVAYVEKIHRGIPTGLESERICLIFSFFFWLQGSAIFIEVKLASYAYLKFSNFLATVFGEFVAMGGYL